MVNVYKSAAEKMLSGIMFTARQERYRGPVCFYILYLGSTIHGLGAGTGIFGAIFTVLYRSYVLWF
jgi:hypothetical protein